MKLGEAILQGHALAYGQLSDVIRARGGTYRDTLAHVKQIFSRAGRPEPSDADIENMMAEADHLESRG